MAVIVIRDKHRRERRCVGRRSRLRRLARARLSLHRKLNEIISPPDAARLVRLSALLRLVIGARSPFPPESTSFRIKIIREGEKYGGRKTSQRPMEY
ncbi:hypothetical protein EVAR_34011_1 [Eumeta japonica]|uniref:Uncharacterized protein n=1 Tax=Eumeta variegata TaxID=151549 RepID=A0A4C1VTR1_EUMVA|nr:hypothetical protein EVAR_34011_1 [Eumeta japonica]